MTCGLLAPGGCSFANGDIAQKRPARLCHLVGLFHAVWVQQPPGDYVPIPDVDNYINVLIEKIALDNACVHSRVATRLYETTVRTRILQGRGTKQKAVIFRRRIQRK